MKNFKKKAICLGLAGILGLGGLGINVAEVGAMSTGNTTDVTPTSRPRDSKLDYGSQLVVPNFTLKSDKIILGETESFYPFGGNVLPGTLDVQVKGGLGSNPNSIVINNLNDYSNKPLEIRSTISGVFYIRIQHDATGQFPTCNGRPVEWITVEVRKQPTSVKFANKSYKIEVGKKFTPKVKFNSDEYSSQTSYDYDNKYLSIDGNGFKGVKAGKTTLTFKTANGVSCSVKVDVVKKSTKKTAKSSKKNTTKKSMKKTTKSSKKNTKKTTKSSKKNTSKSSKK